MRHLTLSDMPCRREGEAPAEPLPRAAARASLRRCRGFTLAELLISLTITAMLLTATMVAIDASFKSYATAAEMASTQATSRLMTHRLLTLIRTSTAHGPLLPDATATPPVTIAGDTITSSYLELQSPNGDFVRLEYRADEDELWVVVTPETGEAFEQPLLGGVTAATFYSTRRLNDSGLWVLERASMDLTIDPGEDATLSVENGRNANIRVVASTMPRKLE